MRLNSVILHLLDNPQQSIHIPYGNAFLNWLNAPILDALGEGDALRIEDPDLYLPLNTLDFEADSSNSFEIVKFWARFITSSRACFYFNVSRESPGSA